MPEALVINASPLIFLGNAGRLELLRATGARVLVPDAVFDEVTRTTHSDSAARSVAEAEWLERLEPIAIPSAVIEWDLGPGESSVIAAALAIPGSRAVIDDLAARRSALSLGLDVMGTLGVVVAAHRRGVVKDVRQLVLELRSSGMWLSDAVIGRVLRLAK